MKTLLNPSDLVGVSFWIVTAAMLASTFFFWIERDRANIRWKTSLTVAALVTGIASLHYFYMREVWILTGESPIVLRYVDWILTVPLQIIEFYLILCALTTVRTALFWRLLFSSLIMLIGGYLAEAGFVNLWGGYFVGLIAWIYIIYELFSGEASKISNSSGTEISKKGFHALRLIVTVGWAIYPIGFVWGYMGQGSSDTLNLIYNLADFVNKIAFGLIIWSLATSAQHKTSHH